MGRIHPTRGTNGGLALERGRRDLKGHSLESRDQPMHLASLRLSVIHHL